MAKLNFDEALEKLADERTVKHSDVQAKALNRKVWVAEWHLPGCLSESSAICTTKESAIESACGFAESDKGIPRGMKTALRKHGRFDSDSELFGTCINTISQMQLRDLL